MGGLREFWRDFTGLFKFRRKRFLCDNCEYDYASACSRPERPNATECPDYRKRGT